MPAKKTSPDKCLGGPQVALDLPASSDAFSQWQQHLSFACGVELTQQADAARFSASANMYMLGKTILLQSATAQSHRMFRTGRDIARTGVNLVQISLHLEGQFAGHCSGRAYRTEPGDISFIDYAQPFDFQTPGYRMIAVLLPRSAMPPALAECGLHGLVPLADLPAKKLLANLMRDTFDCIKDMTMGQAMAALAAILALAEGASSGQLALREDAPLAELDLFSRVQALIERRLGEDDLSVDALVHALNTSRRALYAAFAGHGGVAAYLRERRLQRCCEILKSDQRPHEAIGALAFSMGFRSEAHFSRLFKNRFGLRPSDLRQHGPDQNAVVAPARATGVPPDVIQALID